MTHSSARSFTTIDARGVPLSCNDPRALTSFEQALREFQSYFGDPVATLDASLAITPRFALGHVFRAIALLLSSEAQYLPAVRESLAAAELLDMNSRERRLARAAENWANGELDAARLTFDDILVEYPRDVLALQAAHVTDFYCGDARALRDRVARVLPHWNEGIPGYSYILGLFAFGLEECNEYARAEETGRRALEIEPRGGWAIHAVAHVMEMTGRVDDGSEWLRSREQDWAPDNGLAFHNWWHLALFYLERGDSTGALDMFDECVYPQGSDLSPQLVDASALLWRLMLLGVDVEDRWQHLARDWRAKADVENGYYAFNDVHALMAFVGAGEEEAGARIIEAVARRAHDPQGATLSMMVREVGRAVSRALVAFGTAHYDDAIESLLAVREQAHRYGGSHAQRDLLDLTLMQAAIRSSRARLAEHLLNERIARRPMGGLGRRWLAEARASGGRDRVAA